MKMLSKIYCIFLFLAVSAGCSKDAPAPAVKLPGGGTNPANSTAVEQGSGKSGSTARFTISKGHLFVINDNSKTAKLSVYNISNPGNPELRSSIKLETGVETIFATNDNLFIGTNTGVLIYGLNVPENPVYVSAYEHVTSCDPVVVEGKNAFLTLRGGTDCRQSAINSLEVIDLNNITYPRMISSVDLNSPYGLGVGANGQNGTFVFVCDGAKGLKVYEFNKQKAPKLWLVNTIQNLTCYDLITQGKRILITGPGGISQFDYTNIQDLKLLSTIPVVK